MYLFNDVNKYYFMTKFVIDLSWKVVHNNIKYLNNVTQGMLLLSVRLFSRDDAGVLVDLKFSIHLYVFIKTWVDSPLLKANGVYCVLCVVLWRKKRVWKNTHLKVRGMLVRSDSITQFNFTLSLSNTLIVYQYTPGNIVSATMIWKSSNCR